MTFTPHVLTVPNNLQWLTNDITQEERTNRTNELISSVKRLELHESSIARPVAFLTCPKGYGFPDPVVSGLMPTPTTGNEFPVPAANALLGKYPGHCVKQDAAYTEAIENIKNPSIGTTACADTVEVGTLQICSKISTSACPK